MAGGETSGKILPHHFELVSVSNLSDWDPTSSKSETNIREQYGFMEQLGNTSWRECTKCAPIPSVIECQMLQGNGGCC